MIFSNVSIGNNCIIGPLNVLESGISIGDNVTIQPHGVFARDTIIQNNVFIGPHFTCANDKFIQDGEHGLSKNKKPFKQENITVPAPIMAFLPVNCISSDINFVWISIIYLVSFHICNKNTFYYRLICLL